MFFQFFTLYEMVFKDEVREWFRAGFLNRSPRPPLGATSKGLYRKAPPWHCRTQNETRYFYWWAGSRKCWESLEGGHKPWKFDNHWFNASLLLPESETSWKARIYLSEKYDVFWWCYKNRCMSIRWFSRPLQGGSTRKTIQLSNQQV